MQMLTSFRLVPAALFLTAALGCGVEQTPPPSPPAPEDLVLFFDNTGGPQPPGPPIDYELTVNAGTSWCLHDTQAVTQSDQVGDRLAGCMSEEPDNPVEGIIDSLQPGEYVAFVNVEIGGYHRDYEVVDVYLDGDVLRPWVLLHTPALGKACPSRPPVADLFPKTFALVISGELPAAVEPHVGYVDPASRRTACAPVDDSLACAVSQQRLDVQLDTTDECMGGSSN